MSEKPFHIGKDGTPKRCDAKIQCRLGGEHFESKEKAQAYIEESFTEKYGSLASVTKPNKKNEISDPTEKQFDIKWSNSSQIRDKLREAYKTDKDLSFITDDYWNGAMNFYKIYLENSSRINNDIQDVDEIKEFTPDKQFREVSLALSAYSLELKKDPTIKDLYEDKPSTYTKEMLMNSNYEIENNDELYNPETADQLFDQMTKNLSEEDIKSSKTLDWLKNTNIWSESIMDHVMFTRSKSVYSSREGHQKAFNRLARQIIIDNWKNTPPPPKENFFKLRSQRAKRGYVMEVESYYEGIKIYETNGYGTKIPRITPRKPKEVIKLYDETISDGDFVIETLKRYQGTTKENKIYDLIEEAQIKQIPLEVLINTESIKMPKDISPNTRKEYFQVSNRVAQNNFDSWIQDVRTEKEIAKGLSIIDEKLEYNSQKRHEEEIKFKETLRNEYLNAYFRK